MIPNYYLCVSFDSLKPPTNFFNAKNKPLCIFTLTRLALVQQDNYHLSDISWFKMPPYNKILSYRNLTPVSFLRTLTNISLPCFIEALLLNTTEYILVLEIKMRLLGGKNFLVNFFQSHTKDSFISPFFYYYYYSTQL